MSWSSVGLGRWSTTMGARPAGPATFLSATGTWPVFRMSVLAGAACGKMVCMSTFIKSVTFDCRDAVVAATFWATVLGSNVDEDATSERA